MLHLTFYASLLHLPRLDSIGFFICLLLVVRSFTSLWSMCFFMLWCFICFLDIYWHCFILLYLLFDFTHWTSLYQLAFIHFAYFSTISFIHWIFVLRLESILASNFFIFHFASHCFTLHCYVSNLFTLFYIFW